MILEAFLAIVAGTMLSVENGCRGEVLYEGDKNAIRMNKSELLQREIYFVEPAGKNKMIVHLELLRGE